MANDPIYGQLERPPLSWSEFTERFEDSHALATCDRLTGMGLPCPFCAAPSYTTYPIFQHEQAGLPHPPLFCQECKRIGQFFFEDGQLHGFPTRHFYVLQVSGPAQPTWFVPRIGWVI